MGRAAVMAAAVMAAAVVSAGATPAGAQDRFNPRSGRVTDGFFYRATAALRLNPLGLFGEVRAGFRTRLFDTPGRHPILKNTYIAGGLSFLTSPAFARPGLFVEFSPLAILQLQAVAERVQWYGNFDYFQSFASPRDNFSDAELGRRQDNYATGGWIFSAGALLQFRFGESLVVRSNFRGFRYAMNARNDEPVFYDIFFDALVPTQGWVMANDTDLLYSSPELGLNAGVRFSAIVPSIPDSAYPAGVAPGRDLTTMRVGPLISYTFAERRHRWFNAPAVFLLAQWWLQHPYRTGDGPESVTQAFPMIVVGFSFRGDR